MQTSFFINLFNELNIKIINDYKFPPLVAYNKNELLDVID